MHDDTPDSKALLRQRLWGAAVLIAIAVILLPLLLDGAGTESQFRRVEQLREAPPAFNVERTSAGAGELSDMRSADTRDNAAALRQRAAEIAADPPVTTAAVMAERKVRDALSNTAQAPLTAWVVLAAVKALEADALALRDRLRQAGFASFVQDRDDATDLFKVLVGPILKQDSAAQVRDRVAALLENDPLIQSYP